MLSICRGREPFARGGLWVPRPRVGERGHGWERLGSRAFEGGRGTGGNAVTYGWGAVGAEGSREDAAGMGTGLGSGCRTFAGGRART